MCAMCVRAYVQVCALRGPHRSQKKHFLFHSFEAGSLSEHGAHISLFC